MKHFLLLVLITITSGILHFHHLDWADGHFLHPDELNIGYAVSRLSPDHLNPEFFAYGAFPIYLMYIFGLIPLILEQGIERLSLHGHEALIVGRYISATLATLNIPLIYIIARKMGISKNTTLITTLIATFFIGFIQYAHFATFETFLTFLYLLTALISFETTTKPTRFKRLLLGTIIGITIGTKIVSLYLLTIPFILQYIEHPLESEKKSSRSAKIASILQWLWPRKETIGTLCITALFFIITNPFMILDYEAFLGSMEYERGVATGSLEVFYTRGFIDTIPFIYQVQHVFPFISGYLFTILSLTATVITIVTLVVATVLQKPFKHKGSWIVLFSIFGGYFIFHILMYVKWTRYMVPALPLLLFSMAYVLETVRKSPLYTILNTILIVEVVLRGLSFFTMYSETDTRIAAKEWLNRYTTVATPMLSEVYDPNIIPFNTPFARSITLYDFYALDALPNAKSSLVTALTESEIIILPSDRVYANAFRLPDRFPVAHKYYQGLFEEKLGFSLVFSDQKRACIFPQNIDGLVAPLLCPTNTAYAEGTFSVFDHPRVMIFQKDSTFSFDKLADYFNL